MTRKTAVLIPTFNRAEILRICLISLMRSNHRDPFDIYVIDNGSTDDTRTVCEKFEVGYLKLTKNVYISNAINIGFRKFSMHKKYRYIIILAHDVQTDKNAIYQLIQTLESNKTIGMTGPAAYQYQSKHLSSVGLGIDKSTSLLIPYKKLSSHNKINHFASCLAVRTDVFHSVGGLDGTLFPMVFEEPDLGERILRGGHSIQSSIKSKIYHPIFLEKKKVKEIISKERIINTKERAYLFFRNRILYMYLYSSFLRFCIFLLFINPIIFLLYLPSIELRFLPYALRGLIDGFVGAITMNRKFIKNANRHILNI